MIRTQHKRTLFLVAFLSCHCLVFLSFLSFFLFLWCFSCAPRSCKTCRRVSSLWIGSSWGLIPKKVWAWLASTYIELASKWRMGWHQDHRMDPYFLSFSFPWCSLVSTGVSARVWHCVTWLWSATMTLPLQRLDMSNSDMMRQLTTVIKLVTWIDAFMMSRIRRFIQQIKARFYASLQK